MSVHDLSKSRRELQSYISLSDAFGFFSVVILYILLAEFALENFSHNGVVSLVWPSSGLALAALLIGGKRYTIPVFIGAYLANLIAGTSALLSIGIAVGNSAEALTGYFLLTCNHHFNYNFRRKQDYIWIGIVAGCCSLVAATNGACLLYISGFIGSNSSFYNEFIRWWMGDALGIITLTPIILAWRKPPTDWLDNAKWPEILACFGSTIIMGQAIFLNGHTATLGFIANDYWAFLFVVWAAVRFGIHGSLLVIAIITTEALIGFTLTVTDGEIRNPYGTTLINLWLYIFILTLVGLSLPLVLGALKKSEYRERRSSERYKLLVENAPYCIHEIDNDFRFTSINPAGLKMFDCDDFEQLRKNTLIDFVCDSDKPKIRKLFHDACLGLVSNFDFTSHQGRIYHSCFVPIANSKKAHILGITQDITARKHAEQCVNENSKILELIATDQLPQIIYEKIIRNLEQHIPGSRCCIFLIDDSGEKLHCTSAPSLTNEFRSMINGLPIMEGCGSCGTAVYREEMVIIDDISTHPFGEGFAEQALQNKIHACWSLPFRSSTDRILGTFSVYMDKVGEPNESDIAEVIGASHLTSIIVERTLAQQKLFELTTNLEHIVNERTLGLVKARQNAEHAAKAKSDFISHMSHEIRTPLNSIIGMSYIALQENPDSTEKDLIEKIHYSGEHLLELINNILDMSKIERNMLCIDKHGFSFDKIEENLDALFMIYAAEKNIELRISIDPNIPSTVYGDLQHLNQVMSNLTGNAIKFTRQGEVSIQIKLVSSDKELVKIRFEIIDSGIGISDDQKEKLFVPFEQGDSSITRTYGGTGLGLTISKQLVELMGGTIHYDSSTDAGSSFWFELNFDKYFEELPTANKEVETHHDITALKDTNILIAEDNLINQQVAKKLLENVGAKVVLAANGLEAIELILAHDIKFDCILMDLQMPEMDGIEATKKIRDKYTPDELPIIAVTANISQDDQDACTEAQMNDFISKPVQPELLYKTICVYIDPSLKDSSTETH